MRSHCSWPVKEKRIALTLTLRSFNLSMETCLDVNDDDDDDDDDINPFI